MTEHAPGIRIHDLANIEIDGANAGQIMDVVRNHRSRASDVQRGLIAWQQEQDDKQKAAKAAEIEAIAQQHVERIAELEAVIAEKDTLIADFESVLGGTAAGRKLIAKRRAGRREELLRQLEELGPAE